MTELDVAKGIQSSIASLDLDHPHAREACFGLISTLDRSLGRIKQAEWDEAYAREEADLQAMRDIYASSYPLMTVQVPA